MQIGKNKFKKVGKLYYQITPTGLVNVYDSQQIKYFIWWFNVKQNFNLKTKDD